MFMDTLQWYAENSNAIGKKAPASKFRYFPSVPESWLTHYPASDLTALWRDGVFQMASFIGRPFFDDGVIEVVLREFRTK